MQKNRNREEFYQIDKEHCKILQVLTTAIRQETKGNKRLIDWKGRN